MAGKGRRGYRERKTEGKEMVEVERSKEGRVSGEWESVGAALK
jgi:hypothetical protein